MCLLRRAARDRARRASAGRARKGLEDLLARPVRGREAVLHVGIGTGWLAVGLPRALPGLPVIGVDLSQGMLERARAPGAWPLLRADGHACYPNWRNAI